MRLSIEGLSRNAKRKATSIFLFTYGLGVGTAGPLLLGRCASSGTGCGSCGGFCVLSLSILPLLVFLAVTGRLKRLGGRLFSRLRRSSPSGNVGGA